MYIVDISSYTDIGDVKQTNQDSLSVKTRSSKNCQTCLFIVADGCGGLSYGDVVSKMLTNHFAGIFDGEKFRELTEKKLDGDAINKFLNEQIESVNSRAFEFGQRNGCRVGSTLSLLLTIGNNFFIKNVGDSRVYMKRSGKLKKLTEDQSLLADMLRNGEITEEGAKNFKRKNVLTMCVGGFEKVRVFSAAGRIKNGDAFLLCCDGMYNHVSGEDMISAMAAKYDFEHSAENLRGQIPRGQAGDNVSAIICRFRKKSFLKFTGKS